MSLAADFTLQQGALALHVALQVAPGETLALVGPNGAGKTTLLRVLAGLLRVDTGSVRLGDALLDGGPGGAFVPAERRGVGFVFQEHLLFPHLSALDNVAYGVQRPRALRHEARDVARRWLERVGLAELAACKPAALSGGQAQRVALARALATSPRLLLLDEPLAAVDASARHALRTELRAHLADFAGPRVLVVHGVEDAFALADRLAVLEAGRVVQTGTLPEIVGRPRSRYVADLVGLNCARGSLRDGVLALPDGGELVTASSAAGEVIASFHPRAVALYRERPAGSPRNVWTAPVLGVEPALDCLRVRVGGKLPLVAELTAGAVRELRLTEGGDVWVALKATEIVVAAG